MNWLGHQPRRGTRRSNCDSKPFQACHSGKRTYGSRYGNTHSKRSREAPSLSFEIVATPQLTTIGDSTSNFSQRVSLYDSVGANFPVVGQFEN